MKFFVFIGLFLVTCAFDYELLKPFDNSFRWVLLASVPATFYFFNKKLHWAPALVASYALLQWILKDYQFWGVLPLAVLFGLLGAAAYFRSITDLYFFGTCLIWFGVFQALVAIPQWYGIHWLYMPLDQWTNGIPLGTLGQHTLLGSFMLCCLPPALWRGRYLLAAIILFTALITKSSMTYAGLGAILVLFVWHKANIKYAAAVALAGIIPMLFGLVFFGCKYEIFCSTGRSTFWPLAWQAFLKAPIFGHGLGYWGHIEAPHNIGIINGAVPYQTHNEYLQLLVNWGLVGGIGAVVALGEFLLKLRPTWYHAVVCAVLVNMIGQFSQQIPGVAFIFVILWTSCMRGEMQLKWVPNQLKERVWKLLELKKLKKQS